MPYDLTEPLVIGISSRALFNLEEENRIYENEGLAAYEEYQVKHESDILQKGSAFQLVKAFLQLNKLQEKRLRAIPPLGLRWLLHEMPQHMNGQSKPCENGMSILMRRFSLGE